MGGHFQWPPIFDSLVTDRGFDPAQKLTTWRGSGPYGCSAKTQHHSSLTIALFRGSHLEQLNQILRVPAQDLLAIGIRERIEFVLVSALGKFV